MYDEFNFWKALGPVLIQRHFNCYIQTTPSSQKSGCGELGWFSLMCRHRFGDVCHTKTTLLLVRTEV